MVKKRRRFGAPIKRTKSSRAFLMTLQPLTDIKACVFDGTLFDLAAATRRCADVLGDKTTPLAALWRDKQLQYTWLLTAQGRYADFAQVTAAALDFALETLAIPGPDVRERLMELYFDSLPTVSGRMIYRRRLARQMIMPFFWPGGSLGERRAVAP
jgi:hypothetical protein